MLEMRALKKVKMLLFVGWFLCPTALATAAASIAIFPLQELREGRNDANLPITRILATRLSASGNEIVDLKTVIAFMANNRIRIVGNLDSRRIAQVRDDLGAGFVLLGTVSQQKELPEPSLGLTLSLVRTSDSRIVWSYVGSVSTGEERRVLAIGEPQNVAELQPMLMDEVIDQWPWQSIQEVQQAGAINIDSVTLEPRQVRPGDEVHGRVRLQKSWPDGQSPRVFFKANEQLYPATLSSDQSTYEGTWVAGDVDGRFTVNLLLEWPLYGRSQSALLGTYLVDGRPPLFELDLARAKILDGMPVFDYNLEIVPRILVRKPLSRWRLAFYSDSGYRVGALDGTGNLPRLFSWAGVGGDGRLEDGIYLVELEVWDKAGNTAKASRKVTIDRSLPRIDLKVERNDTGLIVDLDEHGGPIPLASWRLEMWTKEGKLLTHNEGLDLPVKLGVDLPEGQETLDIQGVLVIEDVLGRQVRRKVENLLPQLQKKAESTARAAEKKSKTISEKWVDEF